MLGWFETNREWLFSGAGVVAFVAVVSFFWRQRRRVRRVAAKVVARCHRLLTGEASSEVTLEAGATGDETESKADVAQAAEEERAALRTRLGARQLHDLENGMVISRLPDGVYGFTTSWSILRPHALDKHSGGTTCVEVIIASDGSIHVVGYVMDGDFLAAMSRRDLLVRVYLVPFQHGKFSNLVALPLSSFKSCSDRSLPDGVPMIEVTLLPSVAGGD